MFLKLDKKAQERIREKLQELKTHPDITSVLKALHSIPPTTHRLRVGNYRILLKHVSPNTFYILKVGHRRDIYR